MKSLLPLFLILNVNLFSQRVDFQPLYVPEDLAFRTEMAKRHHENQVAEIQSKINRIKELYSRAPQYPTTVGDGIHNVEATDNKYEVGSMEVLIKNNKVVDITKGGQRSNAIAYSSNIMYGKALVKINIDGKDLGYFDFYFIEDCYK